MSRYLLSRLATASASHGASAHEPSRLARPGNRHAISTRRAQTVLPAQAKVFHTSQRSQRPSLPPRAIAAHHPPRLVRQKRSPELWPGGKDSGLGRTVPRMRAAATMTKAPGASVYMPPEALEDIKRKKEKHQIMMQASISSPLVWCLFSLSVKPSPANCWLTTIATNREGLLVAVN